VPVVDILDAAEPFAAEMPGYTVVGYAWRRRPAGRPALLFSHANGFNAGCYVPFLARLAGEFQVFAFDLRGHGRSTGPDPAIPGAYDLADMGRDLAAIAAIVRDRLPAGTPLHLVSHSVGGHVAILQQAQPEPVPWATMTLFEPPLHPPYHHRLHVDSSAHSDVFVAWALRRPTCYDDAAAWEKGSRAGMFAAFSDEMRAQYLHAAVAPERDGRLRLRCPGAVEAAIYRACDQTNSTEVARMLNMPVMIYANDPRAGRGRRWLVEMLGEVADSLPTGQGRAMLGHGHLMVQEDPDLAAEAVRAHVHRGEAVAGSLPIAALLAQL
jgi:pimeloyl-ACP methyl ester carboxylesterase